MIYTSLNDSMFFENDASSSGGDLIKSPLPFSFHSSYMEIDDVESYSVGTECLEGGIT